MTPTIRLHLRLKWCMIFMFVFLLFCTCVDEAESSRRRTTGGSTYDRGSRRRDMSTSRLEGNTPTNVKNSNVNQSRKHVYYIRTDLEICEIYANSSANEISRRLSSIQLHLTEIHTL